MNSLHQPTIIALMTPSTSINSSRAVNFIRNNPNQKELENSELTRLLTPRQKLNPQIESNQENIDKKDSYPIINHKITYKSHSNKKFYLPAPKLKTHKLALNKEKNFSVTDPHINKDYKNISLTSFKTPRTLDKNLEELSNKNKFLTTSKKNSSSIQYKKFAIRSQDFINRISDFYDTSQISSAVFGVNETHEKVKMIDMILKRREEMKDLEDELRFQKYYNVLQRFARDIKKRLKNNADKKTNFSKSSAKFLAHQDENKDIISHPIVQLEKTKTVKFVEEAAEEFNSPTFCKNLVKIRRQQSNLKEVYEINKKDNLKNQELESFDQKTSLNILKFANLKSPPKRNPQIAPPSPTNKEKICADALKKCTFFRQREVLKENLEAASRTVENDLYNYLLQSEKNGAADIILGENVSPAHKNFKIKNIELNVKKKLADHKTIIHKKNYHPSNIQSIALPPTLPDELDFDSITNNKINRIRFSEPNTRKIFIPPTPLTPLIPNPNPPSLLNIPLLISTVPPQKKLNSIPQ